MGHDRALGAASKIASGRPDHINIRRPDIRHEIATVGPDRVPADDAFAPGTFVDKIDVPVFIAGSWQDEETGGHFPEMLDKFATVQMIDVYVPTTDGYELSLTRYTQPEAELKLLLDKLKLGLPAQAPPKISAVHAAMACSEV